MTMKFPAMGFRSKKLQYTTGAGHSAKENSGVGCACPQPSKIAIFATTYIGDRLGELYGGARVWQESCAWGRDYTAALPDSEPSPCCCFSKVLKLIGCGQISWVGLGIRITAEY